MNFPISNIVLMISGFLSLVACGGGYNCSYQFEERQISAYRELSKYLLADSSNHNLLGYTELSEEIIEENYSHIERLDYIPHSYKLNSEKRRVNFLLKYRTKWFMEKDYLILIVGLFSEFPLIDSSEDIDHQIRFNCKTEIAHDMILISESIQN